VEGGKPEDVEKTLAARTYASFNSISTFFFVWFSRNNLWIKDRFFPKAQSHLLEHSHDSKNLF